MLTNKNVIKENEFDNNQKTTKNANKNNKNNNNNNNNISNQTNSEVCKFVKSKFNKTTENFFKDFKKVQKDSPLNLIPQLCNEFYYLGWVSGTGGGLSILKDNKIYCAPSGVQKERIKPEDMFILNEDGNVILKGPKNSKLKVSECLSLFMVAFKSRQANCCIHIHSIYANLVTAYYNEKNKNLIKSNNNNNNDNDNDNQLLLFNEFRISNQEMIKGIKKGSTNESLQYNDTLIVPIIDNVLHEKDLAGSMKEAIDKYPLTNAVLVRNHGCYIWGKSWEQAKSMAECYDYLFKLKIETIKCGFNWLLNE